MAVGIAKCVKSGGVQVLLPVVGLPVVQLGMNREHIFNHIILIQTIKTYCSVRKGSVYCPLCIRYFTSLAQVCPRIAVT